MNTQEQHHKHIEKMAEAEDKQRTIVLYSPDIDFCVSLRFLFQDRYTMITLTDLTMLMTTVKEFHPDLVIVDGLPTERMHRRFEMMRHEDPHLRTMFFYVSRLNDINVHNDLNQWVDMAFSKPVDVMEITHSIRTLIEQPS